jgi:hypothetical protein
MMKDKREMMNVGSPFGLDFNNIMPAAGPDFHLSSFFFHHSKNQFNKTPSIKT